MISQEMLDYIRRQQKLGVSKKTIIWSLQGGGWNAQDLEEAFRAVEGQSGQANSADSTSVPASSGVYQTAQIVCEPQSGRTVVAAIVLTVIVVVLSGYVALEVLGVQVVIP